MRIEIILCILLIGCASSLTGKVTQETYSVYPYSYVLEGKTILAGHLILESSTSLKGHSIKLCGDECITFTADDTNCASEYMCSYDVPLEKTITADVDKKRVAAAKIEGTTITQIGGSGTTKTDCKDCSTYEHQLESANTELNDFEEKRTRLINHLNAIKDAFTATAKISGEYVAAAQYGPREVSTAKQIDLVNSLTDKLRDRINDLKKKIKECKALPIPDCEKSVESGSKSSASEDDFVTESTPKCIDSDAGEQWPEEVTGFVRIQKTGSAKEYKDSCRQQKAAYTGQPSLAVVTEWYCDSDGAKSTEIVCNNKQCSPDEFACQKSLNPVECGDFQATGEEQCDPPGAKCVNDVEHGQSTGTCNKKCACDWTSYTPTTQKQETPGEIIPPSNPPALGQDPELLVPKQESVVRMQIDTPIVPPASEQSCEDTDDQVDIFTPGSVSGVHEDGTAFTFTDSCLQNSLTEYFCDYKSPDSKTQVCEHGCELGRCIYVEPNPIKKAVDAALEWWRRFIYPEPNDSNPGVLGRKG